VKAGEINMRNLKISTSLILVMVLSSLALLSSLPQLEGEEGSYPLLPSDPAIASALDYLRDAQTGSGDIGGPSTSAWAVMALAAAGEDPHEWRSSPGNPSIMEYLASLKDELNSATDWERQILAITAAGENPYDFDGVNCVAALEGFHHGVQVGEPSLLNDDIWSLLALVASDRKNSPAFTGALTTLKEMQNPDGGWGYGVDIGSDVDDTAAAIMALIAAGEDPNSEQISKALDYLKEAQNSDGGFPYSKGESSNSASTSWAILAIDAAGQDPTSSQWSKDGKNPVAYLLGLQNGDGSFQYILGQTSSPEWMTAYAVTALLGKPYPVKIIDVVHVKVRVEAPSGTIWSGDVALYGEFTVEAHNSGVSYTFSALTPLGALDAASRKGSFEYSVNDQYISMDLYVDSIGGESAQGMYGWLYRVNAVSTAYGACKGWLSNGPQLKDGDEILWYYGTVGVYPLRLTVDKATVLVDEPLEVKVETLSGEATHNPGQPWPETEWKPIEGVTVHGLATYQTEVGGTISVGFNESGVFELYADKWGETVEDQYIRSGRVKVSVLTPFRYEIRHEEQRFNVTVKTPVQVSEFNFNQSEKKISFKLSGGEERIPCLIEIPNTLLSGTFQVTVDGVPASFTTLTNETHTILSFYYMPSIHKVEITGTTVIPEFPSITAATATLSVLYVYVAYILTRNRKWKGRVRLETASS